MRTERRAWAASLVIGASLFLAHAMPARADDMLVRVTGAPEGATVTVDREPVGRLPFDVTLAPGLHYFVVTAPGYYRELRDVEVAPSADPLEVRFDLTLDPAQQPRGANAPMIVGGSVLALGGVAGIVLAIVGALGDRRCSARCDEAGGRHVVERPAVDSIVAWSVAGGISLVVGAVLIGFGATAGGRPSATTVSLRPDGLELTF